MENSPKENINTLRNFIKYKASNKGLTLTKLMAKVAETYNRKPDVSNYTGKIRRGTLSVLELYEIMDILGIAIEFKDINTK